MLTKYRHTNNWPGFVPFAHFDWAPPGRTFENLRLDFDRVFGACERSVCSPVASSAENVVLRDAVDNLVLSVDLPGVSTKDVELSINGDNVSIRASRTVTAPEGYTTLRSERSSYKFEHTFKLPMPVETQRAEAKLQDGVLTITLPKSPNAQPRQIQVKAG